MEDVSFYLLISLCCVVVCFRGPGFIFSEFHVFILVEGGEDFVAFFSVLLLIMLLV